MSASSKPPSAQARLEAVTARRVRDPYANLLRDTRGMRREVAAAREAWFSALNLDRKEDVLFELETLLKSVVAWSNPRNHPRRAGVARSADRDFHPHLLITRAVLARALALCNQLIGAHRGGGLVGRNLAVGVRDDSAPEPTPSEGPVDALLSLRSGLGVHLEVLDGIARSETVPYRLFFGASEAARREIARNSCFNPLQVIEFRPEFDRVRSPEMLEALQAADGEAPHRAVALAILGQNRQLRLAQLLVHTALDPTASRRSYAILAVIRAEQRALGELIGARVGGALADAIEREALSVPAHELKQRFDSLSREIERHRALRNTLQATAASLEAECRRALYLRVSPCEEPASHSDLSAQCAVVSQRLKEAAQDNILQLAATLRGAVDPERFFADRTARRASTERGRERAWLFLVVLRAFIEKAKAVTADEGATWDWSPASTFAADFVGHFERVGRSLAARSEYPDAQRLEHAVLALVETDLPTAAELTAAERECVSFSSWLKSWIDQQGRREELRAIPLDRSAASELLRAYVAPLP